MTDQQMLETLYPEPHALTDSDRASMRSELFGTTSARSLHSVSDEDRVVDTAPDAVDGLELTTRTNNDRRSDTVAGRRWLGVAAAAVLLVGIAGIWAAGTRNSGEAPAPAQQPTTSSSPTPEASTAPSAPASTVPRQRFSSEPTAFPVLDELPEGLSADDDGRSLDPLLPSEIFRYSPDDEHNLIKTYYARLNQCLADAGHEPIDPAIDSAALIRSERQALRQLQADPSSDVSIPERAMLGIAGGTAEQLRCSDAAYDSLRTASGRAFGEDPIEAIEAGIGISERVADELEPQQAAWTDCMRDAGFPNARMSGWSNATSAWTAADDHCRAASAYNERKVKLLTRNTRQWAIENSDLVEALLGEMDHVVQQAETLP